MIDFESQAKPEGVKVENKFSPEKMGEILNEVRESKPTSCMNCLVLGLDGTAKSGIVLSYIAKLPKESVVIDLDGGDLPLKIKYHKDTNILVWNPLQTKINNDGSGTVEAVIDYKGTMTAIRSMLVYVKENHEKFSAVVLDGLSTLMKHAEYQLRMEKNIKLDGDVSPKYWTSREKYFIETIEFMKSIPIIDKFYIGHDDFIIPKEIEELDMSKYRKDVKNKYPTDSKKQLGELLKIPMLKRKLNQTVHQRIICSKIDTDNAVYFVAKVDKSKYDIIKEGVEIVFGEVNKADKKLVKWNCDEIFGGLK